MVSVSSLALSSQSVTEQADIQSEGHPHVHENTRENLLMCRSHHESEQTRELPAVIHIRTITKDRVLPRPSLYPSLYVATT